MSRTRYLEAREPRIEIVPMIDIMMFLLIFFMVTMLKMIDMSGIKINVPQAATAVALPKATVTITVDKGGELYFEGQPVSAEALTQTLSARAAQAKLEVLVASERDVPLQSVLRAMDVARAAGVEDLGIAAKR
ncbi:ExbD/TolR family protein [Paraburkholderia caledonica]|uniref:Biopolymer transport protein ExbD n=1 Tax=Paraburkholderia caledonica TaxID=134536 RepID=A0AB73IPG5_9BURK|nr:biopolymer transport protein ExbD [Paraburkholderia caledonica]